MADFGIWKTCCHDTEQRRRGHGLRFGQPPHSAPDELANPAARLGFANPSEAAQTKIMSVQDKNLLLLPIVFSAN